jgi:flagellar hook-associated protein 1 FlgK
VPSRQSLISAANAMITRFQTLDQRFTEIRDGVNSQISESVNTINSYAQQIASINEKIVLQSGSGHTPNDLLDQRDTLIAKLNELVRVTVLKQDDGGVNIFIGNGQALVVGQSANALAVQPSVEDPQRYEVAYKVGSSTVLLPNGSLTGGTLGGLLEFRSTSLDEAQNALGRIALSLATTFNEQHALGQDLNGNLGGDFFAVPQPVVLIGSNNTGTGALTAALGNVSNLTTSDYRVKFDGTNYQVTDLATSTTSTVTPANLSTAVPGLTLTVAGTPATGDVFTVMGTRFAARDIALSSTLNTSTIAAAAPVVASAATANTGSLKVTANGVTDVSGLPLGSAITLTYNSTSGEFVVTGATPAVANIPYTSGSEMTINGVTLTLSGAPADGDVVTLGNNVGGISDNRNALLLAKLQTAKTMVGGTTSFQGAYSQMVSEIGNKTAEVQVSAAAETNLLAQAKNSQQALSGVNLDEEAANLLRYQQAYQAAGKMMQIASTLFDTLLAIGG